MKERRGSMGVMGRGGMLTEEVGKEKKLVEMRSKGA